MRDENELVTTAETADIIAKVSGRPCTPENVRRIARAGQLEIAAIVGNGQRIFTYGAAVRFGEHRRHRGEAA